MDNRDFSNLGDHIRDSVQSAIDSMDFKQLNRTISDTVNFALDEAKNQLSKGAGSFRSAVYEERKKAESLSGQADHAKERYGKEKGRSGPGYRAFQTSGRRESTVSYEKGGRQKKALPKLNQSGKVAGILYTVFGSIGMGISVLALFAVWILALLFKPFFWAVTGATVFLLILAGGFGIMLRTGISMQSRLKRAYLYLKQAGDKMYCDIEDLTSATGKSKDFVVKDLKKMIANGIFTDAYIDETHTCLMLNRETYQQYLDCQKALKERERQDILEEKQAPESQGQYTNEFTQMMAEGQNYMRILREANDAIPGEVISEKIYRLETVIRKIFDAAKRRPRQMEEMERFMNYYLPTTVKLVNAYRDFDSVGTDGTNIGSAKDEIEKTLDTINQAFERLLDDMFQEAALDITTDASVLQTMLKKDGFAESDFTGGKRNE